MKTTNNQQIFDNCFRWQYVGRCAVFYLWYVIEGLVLLALCMWGVPALMSFVLHEEIVLDIQIKYFLIWTTILFFGIYLLIYALISLPRMSTGIYRINGEYLQVKEKILGINLVDMYIPLSALTAVCLKKERRGKWRYYPYKILEIEASGISYNLHCLAYQNELYEHLSKAIENNINA